MDCEGVRARYIEALVRGQAIAEEVGAHLSTCHGCRAEAESFAATWTALASLPLAEPRANIARRLQWWIRAEAAREALVSLERWQQAALAGVVGFVVSVLLTFVVPYEAMVAVCQAVAPAGLPAPVAYLMAGVLYGLIPMMLGVAIPARGAAVPSVLGLLEAPVVFLVALVPYVLLRCGDFPLALLVGFIAGIAAGAIAGGGAGTWLGRRHAWV